MRVRHNIVVLSLLTAGTFGSSADALAGDMFVSDPLSNKALSEERGMVGFDSELLGISQLEANASNNTSVNTISGANVISDEALSGSQGIVSLIQNSGSNVIIQSSTTVNLSLK